MRARSVNRTYHFRNRFNPRKCILWLLHHIQRDQLKNPIHGCTEHPTSYNCHNLREIWRQTFLCSSSVASWTNVLRQLVLAQETAPHHSQGKIALLNSEINLSVWHKKKKAKEWRVSTFRRRAAPGSARLSGTKSKHRRQFSVLWSCTGIVSKACWFVPCSNRHKEASSMLHTRYIALYISESYTLVPRVPFKSLPRFHLEIVNLTANIPPSPLPST